MRRPEDITHNGRTLADILDLHKLWLDGDPKGEQADLIEADLIEADLRWACLCGACLCEATLAGGDLRWAIMRGACLCEATLTEADLRWADLRWADMREADMRGADMRGADLIGADLRGAKLPNGIPRIDRIHQRVWEAARQPGALDMRHWHCNTAHCRAGWIVTLAGDAGRALEVELTTPTAAALIYAASDPELEAVPDFFASNDEAIADMKRLAEEEASREGNA
tara:strand:+ start:225 stop:902 length:678 start_codon:yes stop_codon:yes gene_type:complete